MGVFSLVQLSYPLHYTVGPKASKSGSKSGGGAGKGAGKKSEEPPSSSEEDYAKALKEFRLNWLK